MPAIEVQAKDMVACVVVVGLGPPARLIENRDTARLDMQVVGITHTMGLAQVAPVQIVHPGLELPPDLRSQLLMLGVKEIVLKPQSRIHLG